MLTQVGYVSVKAEDAYHCLLSIPINKARANDFLDGLEAAWSFHSTQSWLKDPPSTYTAKPVDLIGSLSDIRAGVENGTVDGEYKLQLAVQDLIWQVADGHFTFDMDLGSAFKFTDNETGSIVSIAEHSNELPLRYYSITDLRAALSGTANISAITLINGINATRYMQSLAYYTYYADPDSAWNQAFTDIPRTDMHQYYGIFSSGPFRSNLYRGPVTTISYANGTSNNYTNMASSPLDFTGVDSGQAFYDKFISTKLNTTCNFTAGGLTAPQQTQNTTGAVIRPHFPASQYVDAEGTIAGYLLNGSYSDIAVLSITSFEENAPQISQKVLSNFLDACQKTGRKQLLIDVSSNSGGNAFLPFDYFKQVRRSRCSYEPLLMCQLFPSVEPYNANIARASPELDLLLSNVSAANEMRRQQGTSLEELETSGGYLIFDTATYTSLNGSALSSQELLGPVAYHGDVYTNLFSRHYSDPNVTLAGGSLVVSGYGNMSSVAPQPFKSEDILLISNGQCDSACALFAHYLKYQGKVKQLAIGGRPQEGPMSAVGGTRSSLVESLWNLMEYVEAGQTLLPNFKELIEVTQLGSLAKNGCALQNRAADPTLQTALQVNLFNNIAQGDENLTPIQFTYEAADCRIFNTAAMVLNMTATWTAAADVWRGNFHGCVAGSTGQNTSLSGDGGLYNGGKLDNDTVIGNGSTQGGTSHSNTLTSGAAKNTLYWLLPGLAFAGAIAGL